MALVDDKCSVRILVRRETVDNLGEWCRTNGNEYSVEWEDGIILKFQSCNPYHSSYDLLGLSIHMYDYIALCLGFLYPDILSSYSIRADEDMDFFTDLSEVECLSYSSITGTDDSDSESLIEVAITGCTV